MTREQTILDTRSYYLGIYATVQGTAGALLPRQKLTDRQKMAGIVREVTNSVYRDGSAAAIQASNAVYSELRRESGITGEFTPDVPAAPTISQDVDPIVGEFIKDAYGPDALTNPTYSGEINWVRDQITDAVYDAWLYSLEKAVGNVFRSNIAANVARDPQAIGYQRIARSNACTFCRVVALNLYTSFEQDCGYHKNCACYAVPIFQGQSPYFPEYYEEFERQYEEYKDAPLPEGYQARELQTTNKAEVRRRETFRRIRANIEAETRDFGVVDIIEQAPAITEIEPGVFQLGDKTYDISRGATHLSEEFNAAERDALSNYVGISYSSINSSLRNDEAPSTVPFVNQLDSAMAKSVTTEPATVIRGVDIRAFDFNADPVSVSNRLDQLRFTDPDAVTEYLNSLVGETILDQGYLSTSNVARVNPEVHALQYGSRGIILEIDVPAGTRAIDIPYAVRSTQIVANEQELLLDRRTPIRITEVVTPWTEDTPEDLRRSVFQKTWTLKAEVIE